MCMGNKRLLQLCKYYHPFKGGVELVSELISRAYQMNGHQVYVAAFGDKTCQREGPWGEIILEFKKLFVFMQAPFNLLVLFKLIPFIGKNGITEIIVHLPNPLMHEVAKFLRFFFRKRIHLKCVFHCDVVGKGPLGKIYNCYFKHQMKIYDEIIVSSPNLIQSSPVLSTLKDSCFSVIPFCTLGEQHFERKRKFNGHILAIGRLVPYKGFDFLIKAINKSPYRLTIIGEGPCYEELSALAGPNVQLLGKVSEEHKRGLMAECSCMVLSSVSNAEAYGMVIAEAFECGTPVIASNLPTGVTYLVQNQVTGLVFDIGNEEQLLACLARLEREDGLLQELSLKSREFYLSQLSFEKFAGRVAA